MRPAVCVICPLYADKYHTLQPKKNFCQVYIPAENDFDFFRRCDRELCEAFLTS